MFSVKCPWCKSEICDLHEIVNEDGDSQEYECGGCERKINITLSISYNYDAKKRPEDCNHAKSYSDIYCDECEKYLKAV